MDERNERLVFDRIVRSCCNSRIAGSTQQQQVPQYFLVSPKLLMGLNAMNNDDVTVLMVWNGPGVQKWQLGDVIRNLRSGNKRSHSSEQSIASDRDNLRKRAKVDSPA